MNILPALLYLQWHSARNRTVARLRRLKQPKYLFGALFGLAYLYANFLRFFLPFPGSARFPGRAGELMTPELAALSMGQPLAPIFETLGALLLVGVPPAPAQFVPAPTAPPAGGTATTTVNPDGSVTTTTTTTTTAAPDVAAAPVPGEHVVEIELAVRRGSVQAYFGRAAARERAEVGGLEIDVRLPSSATVTKIAARDKTSEGSKRVTPDNPWAVRVPFSGPGRYVFNIQEWDDDPVVTACTVRVDGAVVFTGRGSEDDLEGWAVKQYGPNVRKTGRREVAFVLQ